jgi:hypothetical protein
LRVERINSAGTEERGEDENSPPHTAPKKPSLGSHNNNNNGGVGGGKCEKAILILNTEFSLAFFLS